jgi:hypothetical protein
MTGVLQLPGNAPPRRLADDLQRFRSRLAVAVASESKSIPLRGWREYFAADARMRALVKGLRHAGGDLPPEQRQQAVRLLACDGGAACMLTHAAEFLDLWGRVTRNGGAGDS